MATETQYFERTKEYSVNGLRAQYLYSFDVIYQESENKLSKEYDQKSKDIMQSIEDDLEKISQKYVDEKE